jgi:hypothetical protein
MFPRVLVFMTVTFAATEVWLACLSLETVVALVALPVVLGTGGWRGVKRSWLSSYPHSVTRLVAALDRWAVWAADPWRNPTWRWKEDATIPLVADLDRHRPCGVGPGDELRHLSFLGRATLLGENCLVFAGKRVVVQVLAGRIQRFAVCQEDCWLPLPFRPPLHVASFRGSVRHRGRQ